ncbi:hypothetical protein [Peribacillus sp. NPDC101480]
MFTEKCLNGIEANKAVCLKNAENSLSLSVVISSRFRYKTANNIALEAYEKNITVKEVAIAKGLLNEAGAAELLNPENLTDPVKMNQVLNSRTH